jgi:hypothetical protein
VIGQVGAAAGTQGLGFVNLKAEIYARDLIG